ncbi:Dihydroorotate dehydrogenase (quinone), mitochondrial [Halotydeus destructor]|nr:Dihydroorotate dehydrogenase (quinone), mitochondrial [Halotydeus destructor]
MTCKPAVQNKIKSCLQILAGGSLSFVGINFYRGDEKFFSNYLMPTVHRLVDAETAHVVAVKLAKHNLLPRLLEPVTNPSILETTVWGIKFRNPIGLAAGFDKDGEAASNLSKLNFGFIEIGSVTPEPQPGNEKPRVFRLVPERAIINRYGFNSSGHQVVKENLDKQFNGSKNNNNKSTVIGVNLGKNKESQDAAKDYTQGLSVFGSCDYVDYFVVNISSPNTPGLRGLQARKEFEQLLDRIIEEREVKAAAKPLLIKISPDLSEKERKDIAEVVLDKNKKKRNIDGLIVSNTTISRPDVVKENAVSSESGGLSGRPLKQLSTETIGDMYRLTRGTVPIIGVGGVFTGQDAFDKVKAGASLVQIYSSLAFEGPPVVRTINNELANLLRENGFSSVGQAVGADNKV